MGNIIEIRNLCKSFKDVKAVNALSFDVREGELFAFLGVNGAGKSTTINIICGQLEKDGGSVIINGHDMDKESDIIKKDLGVVFQNSVLDASLSVYDNLKSRACLYGIMGEEFEKRVNELAELLEFKDYIKRQVGKLSGGQRRRIDVARSLLQKPKILILDEPTTGLDPQTRKTLWDVIEKLQKQEHMTVFLTTHYMEEAADADYIVIINHGSIVANGTPLQLKNEYVSDYIILYNTKEEDVKKLNLEYESIKDAFRVLVPNVKKATGLIINYPDIFNDYEIIKGKMDDVFLAVTGQRLGGIEK